MNMKTKYFLARAGAAFIALATMAAAATAAESLSKEEVQKLGEFGAKAFGIRWSGPLVGAREKNVQAVTDGTTTLTNRGGSRIYILNNKKLTSSLAQLEFTGKDADLQKIGMRALQAAGANPAEVAEIRVLRQNTQSALNDPENRRFKLGPAKAGVRTLMITRQIDGIPVTSSRTVINVDRAGRIAFMELSWPDISPEVIDQAQRLKKLAAERFEAPRMDGAKVESAQAVVLHSPAVGFFDDSTAAIRVIYRAESPTMGKLAVRYLDDNGNDVNMPRQIDLPREEPIKRPDATR